MATITTTTTSAAVPLPHGASIDRNIDTGHLWAAARTAATTIGVFRSTDAGASWTSQGSFTRTGMYELGEMRIDSAGEHMYIVWLENTSSTDSVMFKRVDLRSGSADLTATSVTVASSAASPAGDFYQTAAVVPIRNADGTTYVLTPAAFHSPSFSGIYIYSHLVKNAAGGFATVASSTLIQSTRQYRLALNDTSLSVSADWEHNGDGTTSTTPHVWLAFQIGTNGYALKLTWRGKGGWSSPTTAAIVASGRSSGARDFVGRWDGKRFVIVGQRPSDTTKIDVYERSAANTSNAATRTSPTHSQGVVTSQTLSYNHVTQDFRLFAQGTTTANVYHVDYVRATNTWGTWTQTSATAAIASRHGVRRSTAGTNAYDQWQVQGAGSPWSVVHNTVAVNFAPLAPTWTVGTAGTVPTNGAAADVSASLLFDWTYSDPNTADTQNQYALQRQIGAAAVQWWRTSDSTWQASETWNTSATSAVTLTSGQWVGAGGAADPAHVYKVGVRDAGGLTSAYSAGLAVVPSTRIDPTLTAPTGGAILNVGVVTATWTVSEQSAYRVTVTNTATSVVVYDTGFVAADTTVLSHQVDMTLPDGFQGSLTLQTKNGEGLSSVLRTAAFTVDFVEPVAPTVAVLAPAPQSGGINVTMAQPAPSGAQPATVRLDVWRRRVTTTGVTNINPYFEVNAGDWTNVGYATAARSTAQAHQGVGSLLCTPNGVSATPYAQTSGYAAAVGSRWEVRGWFRSTTANKAVRVRLQWYTAGAVLISESVRDLTPVAGVWVWAAWTATAPDTTATVRAAVGQTATPAAGDTVHFDEVELAPANTDAGIRIEEGVTAGAARLDWRAVTAVPYEYRGYAVAANGTDVFGPWSA